MVSSVHRYRQSLSSVTRLPSVLPSNFSPPILSVSARMPSWCSSDVAPYVFPASALSGPQIGPGGGGRECRRLFFSCVAACGVNRFLIVSITAKIPRMKIERQCSEIKTRRQAHKHTHTHTHTHTHREREREREREKEGIYPVGSHSLWRALSSSPVIFFWPWW